MCDDPNFQTATKLVENYLQHTFFLFEKLTLEEVSVFNHLPNHKKQFYEMLGMEFETHQAVSIGLSLGFQERTTKKYLRQLVDCNILTHAGHVKYSKS